MKKNSYIVFIILCLVIMIIPFVGMTVAPTMKTTENKTLMQLPKLKTEDGWNINYMNDLGEYFQEHFAFRQEMVSANALIYGKIFGASTTDQVIIGKNNWMYYIGTLDDYLVGNTMSERELDYAVHNLKLIQSYVEKRGSKFVLTIAPNKNSIYSENMPYYYVKADEANNYMRLKEKLLQEEISFVDLHEVFGEKDEILYLERDSHWTNKGAVTAYNAIMSAYTSDYETYENVSYEVKKNHLGDLTKMAYPLNSELENNEYYKKDWSWSYDNKVKDNMDEWIETSNNQKNGTLLMYRDSFGESLLPFFAEAFSKGYFSRLVPFNLANVDQYQPDYTVIERVERRISSFATEAPIMEAPTLAIELNDSVNTDTSLEVRTDGGYYVVKGIVDDSYSEKEGNLYILFTNENGKSVAYDPFYVSVTTADRKSQFGYQLYINKTKIPSGNYTVDVVVRNDGEAISLLTQNIVLD